MALDHYVSQVHLRRFNSPALGDLMYAIRKSDLKRFTPNSKDVCRIEEGNTNRYLLEPRTIEEFLKTVEAKYNRAVSALEQGKPDQDTIYVIAGFVAYVHTCSPAAMRLQSVPLEGMLEITARNLDKEGMFPPPPEELAGKTLTDLLRTGNVKIEVDPKYSQAVGVANILHRVSAFGNFHWDVLINEHGDCPFFTSDFPIAFEPTEDQRILNRIIPLSPNTAIRIRPDIRFESSKVDFGFGKFSYRLRRLGRQEAIHINRRLIRSAEDTVFFRDDQHWVAKFVENNRHFRIETKNTQFKMNDGTLQLSSLQIVPYERSSAPASIPATQPRTAAQPTISSPTRNR